MSYTEIYKFKKNGDAEMFAEVKNAFRGAMAIWITVEKRYLPKYIPVWVMGDTSKNYSRITDISGKALNDIWALFDSDKVTEMDKIVLGSSFDNVVVMKDDLPKLIEAFRGFEGDTNLKEQADLIENALKNDDDLIAIAWNQTSVNQSCWECSEYVEGELYGEMDIFPYNLNDHDKHWDLFVTLIEQKK
jgi:hypothetical protein